MRRRTHFSSERRSRGEVYVLEDGAVVERRNAVRRLRRLHQSRTVAQLPINKEVKCRGDSRLQNQINRHQVGEALVRIKAVKPEESKCIVKPAIKHDNTKLRAW